MRILHINQFDSGNGASWAMNRLHHALRDEGVDSRMWVQRSFREKEHIVADNTLFSRLRPHLENLAKVSIGKRGDYQYSTAWLKRIKIPWEEINSADVLHLHWINGGFIPLELLKEFKKPIAWTFHDMWAMTGIRHYPKILMDADDYLPSDNWSEAELECPLDKKYFEQKKNIFKSINLSAIAPSTWMANALTQSTLWKERKVEVIENTINTKKFITADSLEAKKELGLPLDKPLVLFGAMSAMTDERKGCRHLEKILRLMNFRGIDAYVVVFGNDSLQCSFPLSLPTKFLGKVAEQEKLIRIYQACDVMMVPSVQDNFPNTVVESICCGLPVVAFDIGGMKDMINHQKTGSLAEPFSITQFVNGIEYWLKNESLIDQEEIENFRQRVSPSRVAQKHIAFYHTIKDSEAIAVR